MLRRSFVAFFSETQLIGDVEEGAEHSGTIVVGEIDEPGFLDEAAELDEMAGAFAASLCPIAHVGAGLSGEKPSGEGGGLRPAPIQIPAFYC